jgi:DNA-directed RNA polymerase subunit K/omega
MDYKKIKIEPTAVTRRVRDFSKGTNNIYETIVILSKRANQISIEMRDELKKRTEEFALTTTNLEEIFGNHTKTHEIEIANDEKWQIRHWRSLVAAYANSPYFLYYQH